MGDAEIKRWCFDSALRVVHTYFDTHLDWGEPELQAIQRVIAVARKIEEYITEEQVIDK